MQISIYLIIITKIDSFVREKDNKTNNNQNFQGINVFPPPSTFPSQIKDMKLNETITLAFIPFMTVHHS